MFLCLVLVVFCLLLVLLFLVVVVAVVIFSGFCCSIVLLFVFDGNCVFFELVLVVSLLFLVHDACVPLLFRLYNFIV